MKKGQKVALIALTVASYIFLAAFMVFFFVYPYTLQDSTYAEMYTKMDLGIIKDLFVLPFSRGDVEYILGVYEESVALGLSIGALVATGIFFVTLVLGIVFACVKKKFVYLAFIPAWLMAAFTSVAMIGCGGVFLKIVEMYAEYPEAGSFVVMALLAFIFGIVAFVVAVVTYILGLIFGGKKVAEEEKAVEVAAEEAADPEVVEEGEELDYAAPAVVAVPELAPEPEEVEEPVVEEEPEEPKEEPVVEEQPKVEPEPAPVQVNVNNNQTGGSQQGLDQNSLASLLREVVRDIVRDEIARNNANQPQPQQPAPAGNQTITGATFGGPLVVQYFNGGINGVTPAAPTPVVVQAPAPAQVEEKKPEPEPAKEEPKPVEEEKKPEPEPEPVKEEVKPEPAPVVVVEEKPAPLFTKKEEAPEAPKYERLTFSERLLKSDKELQALYSEIKNEILSYGVKSRISANGDTFRLHKKMYVRITVAGKSLKLYFALNPADYANTTIPVQDASNKEMYAEIPLVFKVKSGLSVRRCKDLIQDVMEKDGLEQGEVGKVNWIKEMKAEIASEKKKAKEAE